MQWLARVCVSRPVFAWVLVLVICVLGSFGYSQLAIDRFPKIDFPVVTIITRMPGADPQEVETEITEKIEEAVNTLGGIEDLNSITSEGISQIIVQFVLEKNIDVAVQEVRDKVSGVIAQLPKGIDTPIINKIDPDSTPVMLVALNANLPIRDITEIADKKVKPLIENVNGVGDVTIIGGRERQIHVWLNPYQLKAFNLSAIDVQRAIQSQNLSAPLGAIESGQNRIGLKLKGRMTSPEELQRIVLKQLNGRIVTLSEVARIEDGQAEAETYAARDGKQTVLLSIRKQSGTNTVQLSFDLRDKLKEITARLPKGYAIDVVRDLSEVTQTSVHAVREHLVLGGLFAALIVLIFLGHLGSTLISAIAIPVSIIGTFALMNAMGFSLNTITLLALALAVGIVIDDAIVVLENIFRFIEEKGYSPVQASVLATKEIGLAVLATTLSLIAVFLPMAFMSGIVGRFLSSFGYTMAFSIAVSMLVSFSLTPMLCSRWLKQKKEHHKNRLQILTDKIYLPIEHSYVSALRWIMKRRIWAVLVAFLTLGSCIPLLRVVPKGFLPKSDEAQFEVSIRTKEGTNLESTRLIAERVGKELRAMKETELTILTIGDSNDRAQNLARIFVKLIPPQMRILSQDEIMGRVRQEITSKLPIDLRVQVSLVSAFSGGGSTAALQYRIAGPDFEQLGIYTQSILNMLKKNPSAADVDSNLVIGRPEQRIFIDRARAADLGVEVMDLAQTLSLMMGGLEISSYAEGAEQNPIRVRADHPYRHAVTDLSLVYVPSRTQGLIPLKEVVHIEEGTGPSLINRSNRQRQVTILANTAAGAAVGDLVTAVEKHIESLKMNPAYRAAPIGQSKEIARTARNFGVAFLMAFVFMYLVLAAQFESWLHPLTILLSLPLTVPFALLSLLIFKQQLDIYSMLGLLVLFGVVKKNSILQVDHANHLIKQGYPRDEAVIMGSRDRLRPILMTTFSFVAGMIPLVTSQGVGAGFNRATAGVVVGGQTLSLILTLLMTPIAYSLLDDLSKWLKRRMPSVFADDPQVIKDIAVLEKQSN